MEHQSQTPIFGDWQGAAFTERFDLVRRKKKLKKKMVYLDDTNQSAEAYVKVAPSTLLHPSLLMHQSPAPCNTRFLQEENGDLRRTAMPMHNNGSQDEQPEGRPTRRSNIAERGKKPIRPTYHVKTSSRVQPEQGVVVPLFPEDVNGSTPDENFTQKFELLAKHRERRGREFPLIETATDEIFADKWPQPHYSPETRCHKRDSSKFKGCWIFSCISK